MKKNYLFFSFFFPIFFAVVIFSCRKDSQYPVEPKINYLDFKKFGHDSADFWISFTDGDGDIGLNKGDTFPPFNKSSRYYNNIFLVYQYKDTLGQYRYYIDPTTSDTYQLKYRIPFVTAVGQSKSLSGEIHVRMFAPYAVHPTFRYKCFIYDRALHQSNIIDSPDLSP